MKIREYSSYKDSRFFVSSDSGNYSTILDKLIRLTAKLTECYAGDIFYTMYEMEKWMIVEHRSFDRILMFRENGVTAYDREEIEEKTHYQMDLSLELQQWEIIYDAETQKITLTRVLIR